MTNSGEQKKKKKISVIIAAFPLSSHARASYLFLQELLDAVARRAPRHAPPSAVLPEGDLGGVVRRAAGGCGRRGRVGRARRRVERDRHGAEP